MAISECIVAEFIQLRVIVMIWAVFVSGGTGNLSELKADSAIQHLTVYSLAV
jgi:hypothetical protein